MIHTAQTILSAFDIRGNVLKNRLTVAPMTRVSATEDGLATNTMRRYYARFAAGGFGLVIAEGLYTDLSHSQGYRNQPGMAEDKQAATWQAITDDAHAHNTRMFAQLMHAGALSQENRFRSWNVAPSPIRPKGEQMAFYYGTGAYPMPVALDEAGIAEVIEGFVAAATRAVHIAGFDGIEIHAANGYLLDQFLTAETNDRVDAWGGTVASRLALPVAVLRAVKAALGDAIPVGIRISQAKVNDYLSKWPGKQSDAQAIFGALADAGADFIHITEFEAWRPAFDGSTESLVKLAHQYAPGVPIIANGSLGDAARANDALADGADIVAVGRTALANPDLPTLFESGVAPRPFDPAILGPIADVKDSEICLALSYKEQG